MPDVTHHADNSGSAPMCNGDGLTHRIYVREIGMRQNAVDHDYRLGLGGVCRGEKAASKQWNFHRLQIFWTGLKIERMRRVLHGAGLLRADPERAAIVMLAKRNDIGEVRCLYARDLANA